MLFNNKWAQIWFHLKDVEFREFLKFSVDHFDLEISLHTGIHENLYAGCLVVIHGWSEAEFTPNRVFHKLFTI